MQNQTEQHRAHKRRRISLPQSPSRMDVSANIRKLRQREPLSATLILNEPDGPDDLDRAEELGAVQLGINGKGDNIKARGEIGILSEDLFTELFPSSSSSSLNQEKEESATGNDQIFHVAICLWLPSVICTPQTAKWTILPVMKARSANMMTGTEGQRHSSLKVSSISIAGKSVLRNVERGDLLNNAGLPGLEAQQTSEISAQIRIVDVVPVGLETVFVRIDAGALRKLYTMQAKYGGGFAPESRKNASKKKVQSSNHVHASNMNGDTTISMNRMEHADGVEEYEAQWEYAVRNALKSSRIIRTGDLLPLPLPAHPVTHVPPPPAKVLACEPVSQGIIMPNTRIVMIKGGVSAGTGNTSRTALLTKMPDMNNSQMNISLEKGVTPDDLLSSETSDTDNGDLSDDSENTFSLSSLPLTSQSAGFSSSLSYVTSQPIGSLADGTASPGSVASAFTTSTVRPGCGASSGRTLRTQGLLQAIPDELLQPSPSTSDDEEARVYVESKILVKLQCFSGDWVSMEATVDPSVMHRKIGMRVSEGLMQKHVQGPIRRAVKLFSLPGGHLAGKNKQKSATPERRDRSSSFSDAFLVPSQPIVYLSPILLASLGEPSHVKISPITSTVAARAIGQYNVHKSSVNSSSLPPFANEVTLLKLASPVSTDRALQPSLFAGLRKYFERKRRIAKDGDLVGIAFDESLGRALYDGSAAEDGATSNTELLLSANKMKDGWMDDDNVAALQVAWFRIKHTGIASSEGSCEEDDGSSNASPNDKEDVWGGVVCIDSSNTKMVQAGSEVGRLPSALTNSWQYYLGTKKLPANNVISSVKGLIISDMPTPYVSPLRHRVRQLLESATSERAIYFGLPPSATLLTSTQRHMGKATVAIQACEDLGLHVFSIDAFDIVAESSGGADVKSEGLLKARAERAFSCGVQNIVLLIRHVEALNAERMINALKEIIEDSRAIIFTTTEVEKVPENLRSLFTHELEMTAPDEKEREGLLRDICQNYGVRLASDVNLANTALKTAALVSGDLVDVVERALIARRERLDTLASFASTNVQSTKEETFRSSDSIATSMDVELAGGDFALAVTKADFETAVSAARKTFADAIGAPKIPNVSWSDVGGLAHVKSAVMETIHLPLSRPELFAKGLKKRSGILFYGPPGTGKTLVAKAIATEFSLNFFSVKGPELLNMYIGESEANVRRVFQRARDARPCVVFFDELDSVAPKRGNQGDSGGVMDRIVSQLLSELDGMSGGSSSGGSDGKRGDPEGTATGSSGVFVIGATNRPDLLDQALLRPGRFDKMLYLGVADTHEKQLKIVEALTRKFTLSPSLSLRDVASTLPFTYTGADLYALCSDAMLKAITRQSTLIDAKVRDYNKSIESQVGDTNTDGQPSHNNNTDNRSLVSVAWYFDHVATAEDIAVTVTEADFRAAKAELAPSVSAEELAYYEKVKETFEGTKKDTGSNREKEGQRSLGSGKGKGKLIEGVHNGDGSSTLAIRSSSIANGMTVFDDGIGSSSSNGNAKGRRDLTNATDTLNNSHTNSTDRSTKANTVTAVSTISDSRTNAGMAIAKPSSDNVDGHATGNRMQSEVDANANANANANADADADADSSSSDTSNFDDAQSKVSRVNGLLSRSNSDSDSSSKSGDDDDDDDDDDDNNNNSD